MKPLNSFRNVLYNKTRILPIIIILALQIAVMVFMLSIGVSLIDDLDFNLIKTSKSIIPVLPETKLSVVERQRLKEELQQIEGVTGVIDAKYNIVNSKMIFFVCGTYLVNVQKKDMKLIENALDIEIISGKLPNNSNEIILNTLNLNAFNSTLWQKIGRYASKDPLEMSQDYTVSGMFKGASNIYLSAEENTDKLPYLMLIIEPDKYQTIDLVLSSKYKTLQNHGGYKNFKGFEELARTMLSLLGFIAISLFSFGIWISVMNLMKNNIMARKNEFSFLRSVGYSKKYISKRVFVELFIIMLLGYIAGILMGEIALIIFNSLYCIPAGILFTLWDSLYISVPAMVTLVLLFGGYLSVTRYLGKLEWVSAMEEVA